MHPDHPIARKRWDWVAKLWCQDFVDCMSNPAQALLSWWPRNLHIHKLRHDEASWLGFQGAMTAMTALPSSTCFILFHSESSRDHVLYHRGKRKGYGSVLSICGSSRKRSGLSYNFSMEPVPQIESKWMASQGWNLLHLIKVTSLICAKSLLHLSAKQEGTKLKSHPQRKGEQDICDILIMRRVLKTQHISSFNSKIFKDHKTAMQKVCLSFLQAWAWDSFRSGSHCGLIARWNRAIKELAQSLYDKSCDNYIQLLWQCMWQRMWQLMTHVWPLSGLCLVFGSLERPGSLLCTALLRVTVSHLALLPALSSCGTLWNIVPCWRSWCSFLHLVVYFQLSKCAPLGLCKTC